MCYRNAMRRMLVRNSIEDLKTGIFPSFPEIHYNSSGLNEISWKRKQGSSAQEYEQSDAETFEKMKECSLRLITFQQINWKTIFCIISQALM